MTAAANAQGNPPSWGRRLALLIAVFLVTLLALQQWVERRSAQRAETLRRAELDTIQAVECSDLFRTRPGQLVALSARAHFESGAVCAGSVPVAYRGEAVPGHIRRSYTGSSLVMLRGRLQHVGERLAIIDAVDLIAPDGG